jgi:hypothetical protein
MKSPMSKKKPTAMKSILGPAKAKAKPAASTKKAPAKKKTAAKGDEPMPMAGYHENKTVRITKAENGLTVSSYGPKGEELRVAKSDAEAMRHCKDMLK